MMSLITAIKLQKNNKFFNVFIDGKFTFSLSAEDLVKEGIKVGNELSSEKIQQLIKEYELQKVVDKALNFLSFRPRSEKEIFCFFKRKQLGEKTINLVMAKIKAMGLSNDEEFVKWWMDQRQSFRPEGKKLLRMELRKKGIAEEIINQALDFIPRETEEAQALEVLNKKIRRFEGLSRQDSYKKAYGFLLRRGFSWETAKKTVASFFKKE